MKKKLFFHFFFFQFIFLNYVLKKIFFLWVWSSSRHAQHEICISIKFQNFTLFVNGTICVGNVPVWCKSYLRILFLAIWTSYKLFWILLYSKWITTRKCMKFIVEAKTGWYFNIYLNNVKICGKFKKICDEIYYVPDVCQYF